MILKKCHIDNVRRFYLWKGGWYCKFINRDSWKLFPPVIRRYQYHKNRKDGKILLYWKTLLVKEFCKDYIITVLIKKELKNVVFLHNNFTTEEFQTASARKRQINADNAAADGIFPCLEVPGCILFACVIGIGVPRAECFRVHPFFHF